MKEYIRRYFMLRRHNMKVAIKKAKMSKMCYAFLALGSLKYPSILPFPPNANNIRP